MLGLKSCSIKMAKFYKILGPFNGQEKITIISKPKLKIFKKYTNKY